jgi:hypothetical protein
VVLGLHTTGHFLYFAVGSPGAPDPIRHIGQVRISVDTERVLRRNDPDGLLTIERAVTFLIKRYGITQLRLFMPCDMECWAGLPKLAYDLPEEREAVIRSLMPGQLRPDIVATWHEMGNRDYRMLTLRLKPVTGGYRHVADLVAESELVSEFEVGQKWVAHHASKGGVMVVGCHSNRISVAAYALGGLRAATWFSVEDPADARFLWSMVASEAPWMTGVHDQIIVYGAMSGPYQEALRPMWDSGGRIVRMDSLATMGVRAPEETYGFALEDAFPAIMMAHS